MKTIRRFSMAGPCITLGEVVRETEHFYFYRGSRVAIAGDTSDILKVKKDGERLVHSIPCVSCRDHTQTQYPNGYED